MNMRNYRQTQYRRPRTQVRLTEAELHQVINEAVQQVLIDEGLWGGIQGVGQAAWNGVKNMWGKVKGAYQQGSQNQDINNLLQNLQQATQSIDQFIQFFPQQAQNARTVKTQLSNMVKIAQQVRQVQQNGGNANAAASGTQPMQGGNANAAAGGTQPMRKK